MQLKDRLKLARIRAHLSQKQLAERSGVSQQMISKLETGKAETSGDINDLALATGVNPLWLSNGIGQPNNYISETEKISETEQEYEYGTLPKGKYTVIPNYRIGLSAGHGAFIEHEEINGGMAFRKTWLAEKHLNASDLAVVKVQGDSMAPRLQAGDVVLIDMSCTKIKDGRVYALQGVDGPRIKRLVYRYDGSLLIRSDNPDPQYRDELVPSSEVAKIEIIGRVIWSSADNW